LGQAIANGSRGVSSTALWRSTTPRHGLCYSD